MSKKKVSLDSKFSSKTEFLMMKKDIISQYGTPGSVSAQIALLTARIQYLSEHLKNHKKDHSSRRGLLKLVGQRKRLLNYVRETDYEKFLDLKSQLGIR